jgi:hypothetical protein
MLGHVPWRCTIKILRNEPRYDHLVWHGLVAWMVRAQWHEWFVPSGMNGSCPVAWMVRAQWYEWFVACSGVGVMRMRVIFTRMNVQESVLCVLSLNACVFRYRFHACYRYKHACSGVDVMRVIATRMRVHAPEIAWRLAGLLTCHTCRASLPRPAISLGIVIQRW